MRLARAARRVRRPFWLAADALARLDFLLLVLFVLTRVALVLIESVARNLVTAAATQAVSSVAGQALAAVGLQEAPGWAWPAAGLAGSAASSFA